MKKELTIIMHFYFMMLEKKEYKKFLRYVKNICRISKNLYSGEI